MKMNIYAAHTVLGNGIEVLDLRASNVWNGTCRIPGTVVTVHFP